MNTESIAPGTHVVTPRRGYLHHGIYVGQGRVVHYAGFHRMFRRGPVRETTLEDFANGHALQVHCVHAPRFPADEVIRRARSRLGEDKYSLLRNNCEHFCAWCLTGVPCSHQVDGWASRFGVTGSWWAETKEIIASATRRIRSHQRHRQGLMQRLA